MRVAAASDGSAPEGRRPVHQAQGSLTPRLLCTTVTVTVGQILLCVRSINWRRMEYGDWVKNEEGVRKKGIT